MENALKNLFAVSDLRNRVLFTLGMLGVYRIGAHITTPGIKTAALQALGMDPLDAQIRQVFFFDTPDLTLYQHGVVPRARRKRGRKKLCA